MLGASIELFQKLRKNRDVHKYINNFRLISNYYRIIKSNEGNVPKHLGHKANEPASYYRRLECFFIAKGMAFKSRTYSLKQQMGCSLINPTLSFRNLDL